jgi:F-type H+-transporting ATPase subunit delta
MLGGSAIALRESVKQLDRMVAGDAKLATMLSSELFAFLDALDGSVALVRALANPNRDPASRERLVRTMLAGHAAPAVDLVAFVATQRWSRDEDLPDAVEQLGFEAALAAADAQGNLAKIEAELFEVDITLVNHRDLRTALGDIVAPGEQRGKLAKKVFGQAISPGAMALLARMVTHPRGRGIRYSIKTLGDLVAARRKRLVAVVAAAHELTPAQVARLGQALEAEYGRAVQVNLAVDPQLVGGLRIRVGDDVVDGTMVARFGQLKRAITA